MSGPVTEQTIVSIAGGVLGWALGSLVDLYFPKVGLTKSKKLLLGALLGSLFVILYVQLGWVPWDR